MLHVTEWKGQSILWALWVEGFTAVQWGAVRFGESSACCICFFLPVCDDSQLFSVPFFLSLPHSQLFKLHFSPLSICSKYCFFSLRISPVSGEYLVSFSKSLSRLCTAPSVPSCSLPWRKPGVRGCRLCVDLYSVSSLKRYWHFFFPPWSLCLAG